jgi:hypothetical protein
MRRRHLRQGSSLVEFTLACVVLVPLLLGVVAVGLNLGRAVHVAQVARDAGSMYVRGVDFSKPANQDVLVRLANRISMTRTGGDAVAVLSRITFIPESACEGLSPCNADQQVLVHRVVVGNAALRSSNFRTAGEVVTDADGNVLNYMTDPNAVVTGFTTVLTLRANEFAYVSEFFVPETGTTGFFGSGGVYSRAIF